ncbi:SPO11-like protein [Mya arenaria]|uniref:DNA topoisomerase (ATP-hydrolyzing) n=1 Tax=Mya arenaria TaxID=6604 RepID=A0ABY7FQ43_MYAAR|nr:SPO11-like protein [Mya arenaria]
MYYQASGDFGNQHTLDGLVDNISCMLGVPRWHLHVLASSKGCMAGDLRFQDVDNNFVDCRHTQMGILVPNHVNDLVTSANFILVVEKDATFQKLLETRVCEKLDPCIVITALAFETSNLAVPCMKWLGLLPSDIERLGIPATALLPLTKADRDKGRDLLSRPYMTCLPHWREQVECMLQLERKAELQSLDSISPSFLTDVYLPSKIRCAGCT